MTASTPLRIGTRKSPLALWQAEHVAGKLRSKGFSVELVPITTSGDLLKGSLAQSGGAGLFTKEIQRALLDRRCDIAVHSLKDLPTDPVEGLVLAAVPEREDPSDCLVSIEHRNLDSLPSGTIVGTGSPRRRAQLLAHRPDVRVAEIRGNVDTRLKKLSDGEYGAILLALAGLRRLGLEDRVSQRIPLEIMLPAVGQAALGLETRADDTRSMDAVRTMDDVSSHAAVRCEREVLRQLRAGCLAPVAAHAHWIGDELTMTCRVYASDYARCVTAHQSMSAQASDPSLNDIANALVEGMMTQLISQNAHELILHSKT